MTLSDAAREPHQNIEPTGFEALLPWYVAGHLGRRDRQRVEEALRRDQNLARQADLAREELTETIHLNETLGAPPPRVFERLMASIDADADAARKRAPGAAAGWLTGFFANLSPRTMAVAASFATLAIALQAFMLVDIFTKPESGVSDYGLSAARRSGTFAMVSFARQASAAEITNFLQNYQATLVDGPTPGGFYRVRLAMTALAKEEVGRVIARMRQERIVASAEPSE
jgi:anti-sigma-K factor RskA